MRPNIDYRTRDWAEIKKWITARVADLDAQNRNPLLSPDETLAIRVEINTLEDILGWGNLPDAEPPIPGYAIAPGESRNFI